MLSVRRFGSGPPVVALHGFTLTGTQFRAAARPLNRLIVAPDLPGHGASGAEPASFVETTAALVSLLGTLECPVPMIGYSQGGRLALITALEAPHLISHLVLISATAGIEDPAQRRRRASADRELAERIRREPIGAFIDSWTSSGLTDTAHLPQDVRTADRVIRLGNTSAGLAHALAGLGQGTQEPVWDHLTEIEIPTLILHGDHDMKYREIASRMGEAIGSSTVEAIGNSGHNPLLDSPDEAYRRISGFLDGSR